MDAVSSHRNFDLLTQLDVLHTTELGEMRIRRNLNLPLEADVVQACRDLIAQADKIERRGFDCECGEFDDYHGAADMTK